MRIICDETKGLCIKLNSNEKKRQVTLSDVTNTLLSSLMAAYIGQTMMRTERPCMVSYL